MFSSCWPSAAEPIAVSGPRSRVSGPSSVFGPRSLPASPPAAVLGPILLVRAPVALGSHQGRRGHVLPAGAHVLEGDLALVGRSASLNPVLHTPLDPKGASLLRDGER